MLKPKKGSKYLVLKGSKKFRDAFGAAKYPLYTLIFAFYRSLHLLKVSETSENFNFYLDILKTMNYTKDQNSKLPKPGKPSETRARLCGQEI